MSKLLIHEPPLQVIPSLATRIGLNEAIVLQQLHYLSLRSKDGWVDKTLEAWQAEQFPFWSIDTVKRTFTSLRNLTVVLHEQPGGQVRTRRYRVDYDVVEQLVPEGQPALLQEGNLPSSKRSIAALATVQSAPFPVTGTTEEAEKQTADAASGEPAVTAEVFAVLTSVAARKRCATPGRDAIAKAISEFPEPDHLAVAKDLEFWAMHGNGKRRQNMAIANTYRNFLKRAEPRPASHSAHPRSAYDKPAN